MRACVCDRIFTGTGGDPGALQMATDGKHSPAWLLDVGERWPSSPVNRSAATRDLAAAPAEPGGQVGVG